MLFRFISSGSEKPVFEWSIEAEKDVEGPPGNLSRWSISEVEELKKNHWKSSLIFNEPGNKLGGFDDNS